MTTVSIHQPNFLPWTKLMAKIAASDVHVAFDTVQFNHAEFQSRQRLKNRLGGRSWLSVPIRHTGRRQMLHEVRIVDESDWRSAHLKYLRVHYGSTPYFDEVYSLVQRAYGRPREFLVELNLDLTSELCRYLDIGTKIVRATELPTASDRDRRLLELVRAVGGDVHLTSSGTTYEADWSAFERAHVPVREQCFQHPVYAQPHGDFVAGLSVLDLLFTQGSAAGDTIRASTTFTETPSGATTSPG